MQRQRPTPHSPCPAPHSAPAAPSGVAPLLLLSPIAHAPSRLQSARYGLGYSIVCRKPAEQAAFEKEVMLAVVYDDLMVKRGRDHLRRQRQLVGFDIQQRAKFGAVIWPNPEVRSATCHALVALLSCAACCVRRISRPPRRRSSRRCSSTSTWRGAL